MLRVGRSSSSATCWASLGMAGKRGWVRGKGHSGPTSVTLPFPASFSSDDLMERRIEKISDSQDVTAAEQTPQKPSVRPNKSSRSVRGA